MIDKSLLGLVIKKTRISKRLSQICFAAEIGVTPGFISHMESGHRFPSFDTLNKISEVFDVPITLLFVMAEVPGGDTKKLLKDIKKLFDQTSRVKSHTGDNDARRPNDSG